MTDSGETINFREMLTGSNDPPSENEVGLEVPEGVESLDTIPSITVPPALEKMVADSIESEGIESPQELPTITAEAAEIESSPQPDTVAQEIEEEPFVGDDPESVQEEPLMEIEEVHTAAETEEIEPEEITISEPIFEEEEVEEVEGDGETLIAAKELDELSPFRAPAPEPRAMPPVMDEEIERENEKTDEAVLEEPIATAELEESPGFTGQVGEDDLIEVEGVSDYSGGYFPEQSQPLVLINDEETVQKKRHYLPLIIGSAAAAAVLALVWIGVSGSKTSSREAVAALAPVKATVKPVEPAALVAQATPSEAKPAAQFASPVVKPLVKPEALSPSITIEETIVTSRPPRTYTKTPNFHPETQLQSIQLLVQIGEFREALLHLSDLEKSDPKLETEIKSLRYAALTVWSSSGVKPTTEDVKTILRPLADRGNRIAANFIPGNVRAKPRSIASSADSPFLEPRRSVAPPVESAFLEPPNQRRSPKTAKKPAPAKPKAIVRTKAETGDVPSMISLAHKLLAARQSAEAVSWFRRAADLGSTEAAYNFGEHRLFGKHIDPNPEEGVAYLEKAAHRGESRAMDLLGVCHVRGLGTPVNYDKAIDWFLRAVDAGNTAALYNLGARYAQGQGVIKDERRAANLFREGAELGNAVCMTTYAKCLESGFGVTANATKAALWYQKGARAGNASAIAWCRKTNSDFR